MFSISVDGDKHYINTFGLVDFMVVFRPRVNKKLSSLSLSTKSLKFLAIRLVYTHWRVLLYQKVDLRRGVFSTACLLLFSSCCSCRQRWGWSLLLSCFLRVFSSAYFHSLPSLWPVSSSICLLLLFSVFIPLMKAREFGRWEFSGKAIYHLKFILYAISE